MLLKSVFLEDLFAVGFVDGQRFQGDFLFDLLSVHQLQCLTNPFSARCRVEECGRQLTLADPRNALIGQAIQSGRWNRTMFRLAARYAS